MAVKIGSARIDENGRAHGGSAGDQTGREVSTQDWYSHSKGWVLLRAKNPEAREKIAACMQAACSNRHIGYDQYQRDTLYVESKKFGFDVSKVVKAVETDCSALVRVCVNYAGIPVGNFRTTNESSVLMAAGGFIRFTDEAHCRKSNRLLRGDILVTRTQGHTVVVLSDGADADEERKNDANRPEPPKPAEPQPSEKAKRILVLGSRVNVRVGHSTDFKRIATVSRGSRYEYVASAENGWHAIVFHNQVGWISGKYTKVI